MLFLLNRNDSKKTKCFSRFIFLDPVAIKFVNSIAKKLKERIVLFIKAQHCC